ncbi:hypothetical protein [Hyphomonas jannaschiana]|uniref:hypothetical protein n=1 Tax=Hyphomonas jannaschiana TaxID=86 RepID=UPI0035C6E2FA
MAASKPSITNIKLLFARSGNQCAFPKCRAPMAINNTLLGEICHIKGSKPGSARHDPNQLDSERHAYNNLILLCPNHHTVIDDDEDAYTVDRLALMKSNHEGKTPQISEEESAAVATQYIQSFNNFGQSGGLSAHTVNASHITVQNTSSGFQLTQQRQISAVENLWQIVGKLRAEFKLLVFIDTILTTDELQSYFEAREHSHIADSIREFADITYSIDKMVAAGCDDADKERPFISQRLWSTFFVLQAMYGRTGALVANSYKAQNFKDWRRDDGCMQLLRAVLPSHAIDHAIGIPCGGLKAAIDYLESAFVSEARMNAPDQSNNF